MSVKSDDQPVLFHLHMSDSNPVTEEEITLADGGKAKVIWKDVLVEGEYPMSPSSTGATERPMRVIAEGESDVKTRTISMSDVIEAHTNGAHKYVTIPTSHKDGVLDNTGYVPQPSGLRKIEKRGKQVLQAALGFTEPDVKGKVERGTIPDVSAGIFFNFLNKAKKKRYRCSMKHVALTPVPFMANLDPFPAVFASDDDIPEGTHVEVYEFDTATVDPAAETDNTGSNDSAAKTAEIVWNEKDGAQWIQSQLSEALRPSQPDGGGDMVPSQPTPSYYVTDVSQSKNLALVEEFFKGERTRFVIPFNVDGDAVSPAPATRWTEVREAMIAASDDNDFDEWSYSTLVDRLNVALSDQIGKSDSVYRVDEVALDNRMRVVNKGKGQSWLVQFSLLEDGAVWIQPSQEWESLEASDKPKDDAKRPASPTRAVKLDDSDLNARLEAARQQRRQLVASSSQ